MCTLRSPQGLSKNINDYGDLKDGQSIVPIHRRMLLFLQMERKEFFHFHHMMVPLYYIQKTDKDNQTRYTVRISGYSGWILWIWILWTSDTEFQSQISQVRVNLSVSIP